jgi:hypothetical protein
LLKSVGVFKTRQQLAAHLKMGALQLVYRDAETAQIGM